MGANDQNAVLRTIGIVTCNVDYDDVEDLKTVLTYIKKSPDFLNSSYGRQYVTFLENRIQRIQKGSLSQGTGDFDKLLRKSNEQNERLLQTIDESLLQVANQSTTRKTQQLVWILLLLGVVNTLVSIFMAIFIWKLNMG
jgi:hypothetical protein